jgi:hypothetical protein
MRAAYGFADEKESGVHEDKLPDRDFRCRRVGPMSRDGTALRQYCRIGIRMPRAPTFSLFFHLWSQIRPKQAR